MFSYQSGTQLWHIERKDYCTYIIVCEEDGICRDIHTANFYQSGNLEDFHLPPDVYQAFADWIRNGPNSPAIVPEQSTRDIHLPWGMYGNAEHLGINAPWLIGDRTWLRKRPQGGAK